MKITLSAVVLGSLLAPACSLSYLESLNKANPVMTQPKGSGGPANGASYLDALASPASSAPTGSGMPSYLDALPKSASSAPTGAGLSSYTNSLNAAAAAPAAPAKPAAPAAPVAPAEPAAPAASGASGASGPTTKSYLEAITGSSSSGAPTGAGLTGYLDALPRASSTLSGAGIRSYSDNLPSSNIVSGGAGIQSYAAGLGGDGKVKESYSPFSASTGASFSGKSSGSGVSFTLEAENLSDLIAQLRGNGGTIKLTGSVESVSFN